MNLGRDSRAVILFSDSYIYNTTATTIMNNKNLKLNSTSSLSVMNQRFITGFTDGEGCFCLGLTPVRASFQINLHIKDRAILEEIKAVLGVFLPPSEGVRGRVGKF